MWGFGKKNEERADAGQRADELWAQGSRLLEKRKVTAALRVMRDAFKLEPSRLEGRLNFGAALYLNKQYDEALGHLQYVLALDPKNSMALLNLAACFDALNRMEESVEMLERLVADRPGWRDAHYNLAVAYVKQNNHDKAAQALHEELKINPEHEAARTLLNKIHLMPSRKK